MRLTELDPQVGDKPPGAEASFNFICPLCRKGRIIVHVVPVGHQDAALHAHATTALPPEWDRMTITPSIADEGLCTATRRGCAGWHGFITNGDVTP